MNDERPATRVRAANWLPAAMRAGMLAMGLALIGLSIGTVFQPESSSQMYGVPQPVNQWQWVVATGLRDGILGMFALYLAFFPSGRLMFLFCLLFLPLGDAAIVLNSGGTLVTAAVHLAGAFGIGILLVIEGLRCRGRSGTNE